MDWSSDVCASYLVLALIAIASAGPELSGNPILVVLVVALVYAPRIARIARAAAMDIATRDYVTAARLRRQSAWSVMRRELLPHNSERRRVGKQRSSTCRSEGHADQ